LQSAGSSSSAELRYTKTKRLLRPGGALAVVHPHGVTKTYAGVLNVAR
jgi:hypothetical protein